MLIEVIALKEGEEYYYFGWRLWHLEKVDTSCCFCFNINKIHIRSLTETHLKVDRTKSQRKRTINQFVQLYVNKVTYCSFQHF